jgi:hypothetical protein
VFLNKDTGGKKERVSLLMMLTLFGLLGKSRNIFKNYKNFKAKSKTALNCTINLSKTNNLLIKKVCLLTLRFIMKPSNRTLLKYYH